MSRLPVVGKDYGDWGDILNNFLEQAHNPNGTLKPNQYSLNSLNGVNISNPVGSQVLTYNPTNSSWQNSSVFMGGTNYSFIELEPVKAVLIGNAIGYGPMPAYTYTSAIDSNNNSIVTTITASTNGDLYVDAYYVSVGDRIGVWDSSFYENDPNNNDQLISIAGIYTVTSAGGTNSPFVLTRSTDTNPLAFYTFPVLQSGMYGIYSFNGGNFIATIYFNNGGYSDQREWYMSLSNGGLVQGSSSAPGDLASSEGTLTLATGTASHAEGASTLAPGNFSHAEGLNSAARGYASHAEGQSSANNNSAHSEGYSVADGNISHAENISTSLGDYSHTEGYTVSTTSAIFSHTEGIGAVAYAFGQHAHGSSYLPNNPSIIPNEKTAHNMSLISPNTTVYPHWAQYTRSTAAAQTSDATPTILSSNNEYSGNTSASLQFQDFNITAIVRVRVVASVSQDASAVSAWTFETLISGDHSSSYRWVGTPPVSTLIAQDSAATSWTAALEIGSDNKSIVVNVGGEVGQTINWHATIELDEVY